MLGRVCVVLLLAGLLAPGVPAPLVDEAVAGAPFTKHLRNFAFDGVKVTEASLLLSTTEGYDAYYFVVEADPFISIGDEPQQLVAGFLEVTRLGTDDFICRGQVADVNEVHKHQTCNDLRVGHPYVVTYVVSAPAELQLWGHVPGS